MIRLTVYEPPRTGVVVPTTRVHGMKDRLVTILLSVASTFGLTRAIPDRPEVLDVDRLIVRKELIVSDTGQPWETGFEAHQIPRGVYARSLWDGPAGCGSAAG
jgi:hypothetical protein